MKTLEDRKKELSMALHNEGGAIDLASIMVGIIVIGLIGGVIAATVFAVIPWSQDNAAKHQLDSIVSAQSAYMGLASDSPPALPTGHKANSFADSELLASANLLQSGDDYCAVITDGGKGYQGFSQSDSGKVWSVTDKNTKPTNLGVGSLSLDCSFIAGVLPDGESGGSVPPIDEEAAYVDPTPKTTTFTYMCGDKSKAVSLPILGKVTGKLSWTDGTNNVTENYSNALSLKYISMTMGVEYKVTFEGTYETISSTGTTEQISSNCLRSVDHWGSETGVLYASSAFHGATNLVDVPQHIPSTISSTARMFSGASKINDPDISKWNVSKINNMQEMFSSATNFNQPLNNWDVSNVKSMSNMFSNATNFNQPLNNWETGQVTTMQSMFSKANAFNQPLNSWDVSQVTTMDSMFFYNTAFNQPLNDWKTLNLATVKYMFNGATLFKQDLSGWNVDKITYSSRTPFADSSPMALTANQALLPVWK